MSLAEYDAFVAQMKNVGVGDEAAHRTARLKYPDAAMEREQATERRENVLEKHEQREVVKLFKAFGFTTYSLSQPRASKQTAGLADLYVVHKTLPIALWFETKRQRGGRLSAAQEAFQADNDRCGIRSVVGDRYTAQRLLVTLGLAQVIGDSLEPVRGAR